MDVLILRLGEQNRPAPAQSEKHLAAFRLKIAKTLDRLEAEAAGLQGSPGIGHIAIACALAHLDFRFAADHWRGGRPGLAAWFSDLSGRPSMRATEFVDAF